MGEDRYPKFEGFSPEVEQKRVDLNASQKEEDRISEELESLLLASSKEDIAALREGMDRYAAAREKTSVLFDAWNEAIKREA